MTDREIRTVTRTVTVSDLSPVELASIFAEMSDIEQAAFFDAVAVEAKDWPGMGWCGQAMCLVDKLGPGGMAVVGKLGEWQQSRERTPTPLITEQESE